MHFKGFIFFSLICLFQLKSVKSGMNEDMLQFFERLKMWMPYMDCLKNSTLPVMEPFFNNWTDFNLNHEVGRFKGNFQNTTIENLSKFNFELFSLNILSLTIKANVSLPEIRINGLYDLDGNVGDLIPIYGKGKLEMSLKNVTIGVVGKLSVGSTVTIKDLNIDFNITGFKAHFYGLMGDPELEQVFNKLINDIAIEALQVLWPEIEVSLVDMVKKMIAGEKLTIGDLLKLMEFIKTALPQEVPEECKTKNYFEDNTEVLKSYF